MPVANKSSYLNGAPGRVNQKLDYGCEMLALSILVGAVGYHRLAHLVTHPTSGMYGCSQKHVLSHLHLFR
jgi:hypothetical protein